MTDLVAQLVAIRIRKGLTQSEVARRMITSKSAVSVLEAGRVSPYLATLTRYADAVGARIVVEEIQ